MTTALLEPTTRAPTPGQVPLTSGYLVSANQPPGWKLVAAPPRKLVAEPPYIGPLPRLRVNGRLVRQIATSDEGCACWDGEDKFFGDDGWPLDRRKRRAVKRAYRKARGAE